MALDVGSIKARVKASGLFTQVHDVTLLAGAIQNPGSFVNQAFVTIPKETADPNRRNGGTHLQRIAARVGVSFPLQAQTRAQDRSDLVEAQRSVLKRHMMGWQPDGAETAFDYAYSDIAQTTPGFIWVSLYFDCRYLETAQTAL